MRMSRLFVRTLRDDPADAEAPSHALLVRGGFVRRVTAGVYTFLPLGLRVLRKVEAIVREEMDRAGAQEVRMPALLPSEPWKRSGRWEAYGDDMFKLKDRAGRELGLGPTHEEVVTPLVDGEYASYRDLPVNLYQVQWKYRDEPRPRGGVIRGREFLMKDAYSFDRDAEGLRASYEAMVEAYRRIFERCGLRFVAVEADPGLIGGDVNHEWMAPAEVGEDLYVACPSCGYAANLEAATAAPRGDVDGGEPEAFEEVSTPGRATIEAVVDLLGVPVTWTAKCMFYDVGGDPVAVLVRGDREVNEGKLRRAFAPEPVRMFEEHDFERVGVVKGYAGPQGLQRLGITVVADEDLRGGLNWVVGANRPDAHMTGANEGRDFTVDRWADLSAATAGATCARCGEGDLTIERSIEVGHTFQLGTRYSEPLGATFVDEDGTERHYVMGCYGIGVSRIVASVAEQHLDEQGLVWPVALAPFDAVVIATNMDQPEVVRTAEGVYEDLLAAGVDAVLDDREERAGVKFADADLIGFPVQVVVGARGLAEGTVEVKTRATGDRVAVAVTDVVGEVRAVTGRAS
jgi:prolyl-tRNA synthetase